MCPSFSRGLWWIYLDQRTKRQLWLWALRTRALRREYMLAVLSASMGLA